MDDIFSNEYFNNQVMIYVDNFKVLHVQIEMKILPISTGV